MTINKTPNLCFSQETPPTAEQRNGSEMGCKAVLDNYSVVPRRLSQSWEPPALAVPPLCPLQLGTSWVPVPSLSGLGTLA